MNTLLSVSMLSAHFGRLDQEVEKVNQTSADLVHLDIMDGVFVPNLSYGFPVAELIAQSSQKPLDIHLMIVDPDRYVERFRAIGENAHYLSVHYEANTHLHRTLQQIRKCNMKAGVALNPHTPVELLLDVLEETDFVVVMSVNPGFGGQQFIPQAINKVIRLKEMILKRNPSCLIEVDGGVNAQNAPLLIKAGADILVAGHALFRGGDVQKGIESFRANLRG